MTNLFEEELIETPVETIVAKEQIEKAGFRVYQCSIHHLKYRHFNFYPTSGKITIDPSYRHPDRGVEAFIELLVRRFGADPSVSKER